MHPFMAAELGRRFALERALREGLVPGVWAAAEVESAKAMARAISRRVKVGVTVEMTNGFFIRVLFD